MRHRHQHHTGRSYDAHVTQVNLEYGDYNTYPVGQRLPRKVAERLAMEHARGDTVGFVTDRSGREVAHFVHGRKVSKVYFDSWTSGDVLD